MAKRKYKPKYDDKRELPRIVDGMSRHFKRNNKKEIEAQKYDEIESIEVTDDFSKYKGVGRFFLDNPNKFNVEEKIKLLDDCINWLAEKIEDDSKAILHVLDITTYLGINIGTWYNWGAKDRRLKERQDLISEMIAAKVHNDGLRNKINVIGAIFSLKNQKSDIFKDKQEIEQTNTLKIDSISVGEVQDAKRLDSAEVIELKEDNDE